MRTRVMLMLMAFVALIVASDLEAGRGRSARVSEKFEGVVLRVGSDSISIRTERTDHEIGVTKMTVIKVDDRPAALSEIKVGDEVEVHTWRDKDGKLFALKIEVEGDDEEIAGTIKTVSSTSITVTTRRADVVLTITAATRVVIDGRAATTSDLRAGDHVAVKAMRRSDGSLTALVILAGTEPKKVEGVVTLVSRTSISLRLHDGTILVLAITPATVVTRDHRPIEIIAIAPNDKVEVRYLVDRAGISTALSIDVKDAGKLHEVEGVVVSVTSSLIVVRSDDARTFSLRVTSETIVRRHGRSVPLSEIKVGDKVEIKVRTEVDSLVAVRIDLEAKDDDGRGEHDEIKGSLSAISVSLITLRDRQGREFKVRIDSRTIIERDHKRIEVSQLRVGDKLEIKVRRDVDGTLVALHIKVKGADDDEDGDDD